jgi:SnoaL-like protein
VEERLQEMLDHFEITKTLKEYCRGCDRCDEKLMASVYREDSWDDHGRVKASGFEFTRFMIGDILRRTETLSHLLGQSAITVDGDEAGAETYFIAGMQDTRDDGMKMCNLLGGRFVDRLRREDGKWLIEHRIVLRDWSVSIPVNEDWTDDAGLREGERTGNDPSFDVLRKIHQGHQLVW